MGCHPGLVPTRLSKISAVHWSQCEYLEDLSTGPPRTGSASTWAQPWDSKPAEATRVILQWPLHADILHSVGRLVQSGQ